MSKRSTRAPVPERRRAVDFDRLNADALGRAESLLQGWFPHGRRAGREFRVGDLSGSPGKSLSINLHTGVWCDFASGDKGSGLIGLLMAKERLTAMDAAQRLAQELGRPAVSVVPRRIAAPPPNPAAPASPPKRILPDCYGRGGIEDVLALQRLRHLPMWVGLYLAMRRGLLGFGLTREGGKSVRVWCITDAARRVAQWRRLDGKPWQHLPGNPKAKTLTVRSGEAGWPVGLADAANRKRIILCEGGPDLLAAFHLLYDAFSETPERMEDFGIVTMLGASQTPHPESLPHFKNKHIRFVYHDDEAGKRACVRLATALTDAGAARVDAFRVNGRTLNPEGKDLNDCISADPFDPHFEKLKPLFLS